MQNRVSIDVSGIVQGVGFRPYIYRLANRFHLSGFVQNNTQGVYIEVQGSSESTARFVQILKNQPPPLALITNITVKKRSIRSDESFRIVESETARTRRMLISPDIATCPDCIDELLNPEDRRYKYPFINCTNCGPRFTIIQDIPYDRPYTSMAAFPMCAECQKEYDNPDDRRFHAQPNACPVCGPHVQLLNNSGNKLSGNPIETTIRLLKTGSIIAVKGIGGYHLAADATNDATLRTLRKRKHRFEKPLALMIPAIGIAQKIADVSTEEEKLLLTLQRPIVLCRSREETPISGEVSLDNNLFGIMLPYTPLHELLFSGGDIEYLVMTSANISEEPIIRSDRECLERMRHIADYFLTHNRDIYTRCDDSVMRVEGERSLFIRRSRGFAPRPILLNKEGRSVLAVGGHKKNTICLTQNRFAFLSQHIGDLENLETLEAFEQSISNLQRLLEIQFDTVIHDLHPDYLSTKWALESDIKNRMGLQHHYAHILSVMAEYGLEDDVIGFSMDGTGYGTDGTVWGGEVLICNVQNFLRYAHFENIPMPGGEYAIREPWRMGYALAYIYCPEFKEYIFRNFPEREQEADILEKMIVNKLNSPFTSSLGRLFDGVSAILGIRSHVAYEGQAAIILESRAHEKRSSVPPDIGDFELIEKNNNLIISPREIIRSLLMKSQDGTPVPDLSAAFHYKLAEILLHVAERIRSETGNNSVALSGGCFQNMLLLTELETCLKEKGFQVYTNIQVPPNDGGLCLGQAYWGMFNRNLA